VHKSLRVASLVLGYAAISFLAIALLPKYAAALFSARWPIILLGPLGILLDERYRLDFLQASAVFLALAVPVTLNRTRFTRALALIGVVFWLFVGLIVLSIPY